MTNDIKSLLEEIMIIQKFMKKRGDNRTALEIFEEALQHC